MTGKSEERRKTDRYTINTLLLILGILVGGVIQGERIFPLINKLNITTTENTKDITYIYEKIDAIHEYVQTNKSGD